MIIQKHTKKIFINLIIVFIIFIGKSLNATTNYSIDTVYINGNPYSIPNYNYVEVNLNSEIYFSGLSSFPNSTINIFVEDPFLEMSVSASVDTDEQGRFFYPNNFWLSPLICSTKGSFYIAFDSNEIFLVRVGEFYIDPNIEIDFHSLQNIEVNLNEIDPMYKYYRFYQSNYLNGESISYLSLEEQAEIRMGEALFRQHSDEIFEDFLQEKLDLTPDQSKWIIKGVALVVEGGICILDGGASFPAFIVEASALSFELGFEFYSIYYPDKLSEEKKDELLLYLSAGKLAFSLNGPPIDGVGKVIDAVGLLSDITAGNLDLTNVIESSETDSILMQFHYPGNDPLENFELKFIKTGELPINPFILSNEKVNPPIGSTLDSYVFSVNYYDADGNVPTVKQILLDGNTYDLSLESGTASSGTYSYSTDSLTLGQHSFYFHFENNYDGVKNSSTINEPYVYDGGEPGGSDNLTVSADPSFLQENTCTLITATLTNNIGPLSGKEISFSTEFPGAISGYPPPGCSGPSYEPGTSGITDTNGQVKKYFKPTASGNAVITVTSETGEWKNLGISVSSIPGEASANIYIYADSPGSYYDVETYVTKGGTPVFHKWITLTTSHGEFVDNGTPTGSSTFRDLTDAYGQVPGSNDLGIRITDGYTDYIVVSLLYEEENYTTATTFLCSSSNLGDPLPLTVLETLTTANRVTSLSWAKNGNQLFAGIYSTPNLYSWNCNDWSQKFCLTGLRHDVLASDIKSDNTRVVVGENGGGIEIFDFNGNQIGGENDESSDVSGVAWVGSNVFALAEGSGSTADIYKTNSLLRMTEAGVYSQIIDFDGYDDPRSNLRYNSTIDRFAYSMEYGTNVILYIHSGSNPNSYQTKTLFTDGRAIYEVGFSPSGKKLALVGSFFGVMIVDTLNPETTFMINDDLQYDSAVFMGSSGRIACVDKYNRLRIFEITGTVVYDESLGATDLEWSEVRQELAVGMSDGRVLIYGFDTESPNIENIVISPDTYTIGTIFDISCDLTDNASGINPSSAKVIIRDLSDSIFDEVNLILSSGNTYTCQWDSSGVSAAVYKLGIYVEDNAGNYTEITNAKILNFGIIIPLASPILNSCIAISENQIDISWTYNSSDEDGFKIERTTDGNSWIEVGNLGENATYFSDTGLNSNTLYYFRVWAFNNNGQSCSNILSAKTLKAQGIKVYYPNGGEEILRGEITQIYWSVTGNVQKVNISLHKSGSLVEQIASNITTSSITKNGIYSWNIPADIVLGSDYKIKITDHTSNSIYDSSDGYFSIIEITKTWSSLKRLTWNAGDSYPLYLANESIDHLHIVWADDTVGTPEIYYKQSINGGSTWSTPNRMTWNSGWSWTPSLAVDSGNNLHLLWTDNTPGNFELYFKQRLDSGTAWSPPKRLTWNQGDSYESNIVVDLSNKIHVVWSDASSGNHEIYHKRSQDGGATWSPPKRLTWNQGDSHDPKITVDQSNNLHIVWSDNTSSNYEIYHKKSQDGGATWSPPVRLTWNLGSSSFPHISVDSSNMIHLAWEDDSPGNYEIFYKQSPDNGSSWSGLTRLTYNSGNSNRPTTAADSSNNIYILWDDDTHGNNEVFYKSSSNSGAAWSGLTRLTWNPGNSYGIKVVIDANNNLHVIWSDETPGNAEIFYKNYK